MDKQSSKATIGDLHFSPVQTAAANLLGSMMAVERTYNDDQALERWKATHKVVEDALEAYAAELVRAARTDALDQACKAIEQARAWAREFDTPVKHEQVLDYIRGMDKAEEYIRALMDTPAPPIINIFINGEDIELARLARAYHWAVFNADSGETKVAHAKLMNRLTALGNHKQPAPAGVQDAPQV